MQDKIVIKGAREHNLKNIDLEIPKNKLVVITGISGSGKSSLAFDTIYAEGQRRYVESLSAYARQFLGLMEKPDVDLIEGLSPAISIDQKSASHNPRSTVGTITEIYDYLRLLFARVGHPHCPICGDEISSQTQQQIVDSIISMIKDERSGTYERSQVFILAPIVKGRKGIYDDTLDDLKKKGYLRVRVDGKVYEIDEIPKLDRYKIHNIDAVVDRLIVTGNGEAIDKQRLTESVETALKLGEGFLTVNSGQTSDKLFSEKFACPKDGISIAEIEPRTFSFNSPYGACPHCDGIGFRLEVDPDLVLNPELSISEGGILPWARLQTKDSWYSSILEELAKKYSFSIKEPIGELPSDALKILLYGKPKESFYITYRSRYGRLRNYWSSFEGVIPNLMNKYESTESEWLKGEIQKYMREVTCPECLGARVKRESLAVTIEGYSIWGISKMSIKKASEFFADLKLSEKETHIARQIIKEIKARLKFLVDVGLDYLTIERTAYTLAGGEAQRIRLASQIGSGLSGVLYVLDEPSIGLHARDQHRLIETLKGLRDLGNSVLVVEHDPQTIEAADWVIDIGPGAGENGGRIIAQGTPEEIKNDSNSLTGLYLSGKKKVIIEKTGDSPNLGNSKLILKGAQEHNLKNIDIEFPLGKLISVTGVSGSGKSTLINDILYQALASQFYRTRTKPGKHKGLEGTENLDKVILVDQSPIGRTPRSNPATYTGAFSFIRELFAKTPEARARGYLPGRFSFNVRGGRCEGCLGDGIIKIEMQFLPDVYVTCETCLGARYNREALEIEYKGKNISEILNLTVGEALEFFENIPPVKNKLQTLNDVGLGYIKLGQPAPTLSGGEAQRIKLATELSKKATGKTLYILDEPTVGLHFADIENLLGVLHRLVSLGNSVIVIEHNLDVVASADWIIDLGPEGGEGGGELFAQGTPTDLASNKNSYTGQYLKNILTNLY